MGCYFPEWGVIIWNGVLVNGFECQYMVWGVSKQDCVLVNGMLVNGL